MTGTVEKRLAAKGITLPEVVAPVANYVPWVVTDGMLWISGQIPLVAGEASHVGKLGREFTVEDGYACARICAINILAAAKAALEGDLERVTQVVKLTGFVNCVPEFTDHPKVINGASDLLGEAFAGDAGRHARSAVGAASLPRGVAVEVEAVLAFR